MVSSNYFIKFPISMIIQVFSNSMIFPCMELFLVIFQVFHDFQSLWEPRHLNFMFVSREGSGQSAEANLSLCFLTVISDKISYAGSYEPRHVISNNVAFRQV